MRLIVTLLACLMVLTSVGVGSPARAADAACCMGALGMSADADGCDLTPAECEKSCPNHGACHGHQVAAAPAASLTDRPQRLSSAPVPAMVAPLVPVVLESNLRPPRA